MSRTEQRVLAFCNRIRAKLGLKPRKRLVKGNKDDCFRCVVSNTIASPSSEFIVSDDCSIVAGHNGKEVGVRTPKYIKDFMRRFDAGEYPHLVA